MKLNNEMYDTGKWVVLIFLPAFAVFMGGLGDLYEWVHASELVTTINLLAMFMGSVLQISSHKYHGGGADDDSDDFKAC